MADKDAHNTFNHPLSQENIKGMPTMAHDPGHPIKNVRSLNSSRHTSKFSAAGAAVVGGTTYTGKPLGLMAKPQSTELD